MAALHIPPNSWDSHMHIFDDGSTADLPSANYLPAEHSVNDARVIESSLNISGIVLVQPSVYGDNNSVLFKALEEWAPSNARAVVVFDPNTNSDATLQAWHEKGVRAVRVNVSSTGAGQSLESIRAMIRTMADRIRHLGWVLQMYIHMKSLPGLEDLLPELGVTVVLDHYGHPDFSNATVSNHGDLDIATVPGLDVMMRLLQKMNKETPRLYIKISGAYRLFPHEAVNSTRPTPGWASDTRLAGLTKILLKQWIGDCKGPLRPGNLVFATDWPHSRFSEIDVPAFVASLQQWISEAVMDIKEQRSEVESREFAQKVANALFRDTAEQLWDVSKR